MGRDGLEDQIAAVRRFNRFYTQRIGVLQEGLLRSPFSLAEARVLYELAQRRAPSAKDLARDLGLDQGYLSRVLKGLVERGLAAKTASRLDGRRSHLSLTEAGRAAFAGLNRASHDEIAALLGPLDPGERAWLVGAMDRIERLLAGSPEPRLPYVLRPHRPGDLGWIVHRHGALYAREYGWDATFEALVAEIVAEFARRFDPRLEACWIAERDGEPVGSVMLCRESDEAGKLRLLLVEPKARGFGIGSRLVEECIRQARAVGYRRLRLWTNDVLVSARRIYEAAGFRLIEEQPHRSFGHDLVGQTFELEL